MNDPYKTPKTDFPVVSDEQPSVQSKFHVSRLAAIVAGSVVAAAVFMAVWYATYATASYGIRKYLLIAGGTIALSGIVAFVVLIPVAIWNACRHIK